MGAHLAQTAPPEACRGLFCDGRIVAGLIAGAAIGLLLLGFALLRVRPVNLARRAAGLAPLRWWEIADSSVRGAELAAGDGALQAERALRKQMDWEKEQASHELIRLGSHVSRQWCAAHERWCLHPWEERHPPGGFDNPIVPDDWPPDLRRLPRN